MAEQFFAGGLEWPKDPFKAGWMARMQSDSGKFAGECITQQGLIFQSNKQFGAGTWCTRTEIPTMEELEVLYKSMDIPEQKRGGMVIMAGVFEVPEKGLLFRQIGTASKKTLRGFIKFDTYPIEMASTRAVNRATRFAVGAPVAKDELPGGKNEWEDNGVMDAEAEVIEDAPELASNRQLMGLKSKAAEMHKEGHLSKEQYDTVVDECNRGMEQDRLTKWIEKFGAIINDSKKADEKELQALFDYVDKAVDDGVIEPDRAEDFAISVETAPTKGWVKAQLDGIDEAYEKRAKSDRENEILNQKIEKGESQ